MGSKSVKRALLGLLLLAGAVGLEAQSPNWWSSAWAKTEVATVSLEAVSIQGFNITVNQLSGLFTWGGLPCATTAECSDLAIFGTAFAARTGWLGPRRGQADAIATARALFTDDFTGCASPVNDDFITNQGGEITCIAPGTSADYTAVGATASTGTSDKPMRADAGLAIGTAAISGQSEDTAPAATTSYTLEYDGSALKKVKLSTLTYESINDATEDTAPDNTADFVPTVDTSAGAIKKVKPSRFGSANAKQARFDILFPGAAENIGAWYFPAAATVTEYRCVVIGSSTPSVTTSIKFGTDRSAAGTAITTSPAATTNTTGGATQTLNNTAVSAGSYMWLTTTAQSGNVTELSCSVTFTEP